MPSRDSSGKRIPGHLQRARKAEREAPDPPVAKKPVAKKPAEAKRGRIPDPPATSENSEEQGWFQGSNPFAGLGPPPIENTAQLITWGAKVHALGVAHIAQNPNMYPNRREWVRALLDKTTQLGVIRDKAMEQSRIDAALRREEQDGKKIGQVDVRGRKAPQATRPAS